MIFKKFGGGGGGGGGFDFPLGNVITIEVELPDINPLKTNEINTCHKTSVS